MAELLVLVGQRANRSMVPGDVVTVQPDGWAWGKAELGPEADPMWCVVAVPGAPVSAFTEFLQPVTHNGRQILFRRIHLDMAQIGSIHTLETILAARLEKLDNPLLS